MNNGKQVSSVSFRRGGGGGGRNGHLVYTLPTVTLVCIRGPLIKQDTHHSFGNPQRNHRNTESLF